MKQSPYVIENKRAEFAKKGRRTELKKLYSAKYPEIPDLNSAKFWDKRQFVRQPLSKQDYMTKRRVKIAAGYLPSSAKRILDIGIGHGWVEELLETKKIELYGTDISPKTIKNIQKKFQGNFSVQSIYTLNYKNIVFDAVFLLEVLEHIPPRKTFSILKKIRSLLAPQGYLILSVPTNEGLETMSDNPSGHVRMYTIPLITAELQLSGFTVRKVNTVYAFNKFGFIKNMLAKLLKDRWQPNDIVILAQKREKQR